MNHTHMQIEATVRLPITFRADVNGHDVTIYDLRIGGLVSLYESMPPSVREQINEQAAAAVRGIL